MRFSVLMEMLPKWARYIYGRQKTARQRRRRGVGRKVEKIIVTKFSLDWKKLWLVSHKSWKFVFQKFYAKWWKGHGRDMLPFVACLRNISINWHYLIHYIKISRYMVLFFSKFKRNIFGWKVSEHGPSVLPSHGLLGFIGFMGFMGFMGFNRIFYFQTKYFRLKSVWTRTLGPSNHGLLG
jgi:hypothetical protein